jgi:creatinine amidohydrolase
MSKYFRVSKVAIATITILLLTILASAKNSASKTDASKKHSHSSDSVFLEELTWPELYKAIHEQGKTTALVFNGGTEQRGPQNAIGGHSFIARATAEDIARKLGNAIVAPVLPFSLNRATPAHPGTIGISGAVFSEINEQVTEQLIQNGFKNVILLGDHGGGQKELRELALKLDAKYAPTGAHVFYSDNVYTKANHDFDAWLEEKGYPPSSHGGIPDTSELLYLEGKQNWVRKDLLPTALGDPPRKQGETPDTNAKLIDNGISGDARRSSVALGKRFIDLKVDYAVTQIQQFLSQPASVASAK